MKISDRGWAGLNIKSILAFQLFLAQLIFQKRENKKVKDMFWQSRFLVMKLLNHLFDGQSSSVLFVLGDEYKMEIRGLFV